MRALPVLLLCLAAAVACAAPPPQVAEEYRSGILDSAAVVEAEVLDTPHEVPIERTQGGPNEAPVSVRLRVVTLMAGAGLSVGDEFSTTMSVPALTVCVGDPPTDADRAAHRERWIGLFQPSTRWIAGLDRSDTAQGPVWSLRRVYDSNGPGRAGVDELLTLRRNAQSIVPLLIDLPVLTPYWHTDTLPERMPLILVLNDVTPRCLRLTKFGQPVLILERPEIERRKLAFLEITALEVKGDAATAELRYDVEGVTVAATLTRKDGSWTVQDAKAVEH